MRKIQIRQYVRPYRSGNNLTDKENGQIMRSLQRRGLQIKPEEQNFALAIRWLIQMDHDYLHLDHLENQEYEQKQFIGLLKKLPPSYRTLLMAILQPKEFDVPHSLAYLFRRPMVQALFNYIRKN